MKPTFLSRFTPSLMAPETLEAIFVQRHDLAKRCVDLIRDSALTEAKHHTLLIGARGIGKTHMVALVYHRLRAMADLRDRLRIAWLREEEWGVTSLLDFLLRVFRALDDEYHDAELARNVEALYGLDQAAAERQAAALLREHVGDGTLLVIVENLDDLFAGLGDEGQKKLRAYLQEQPCCTVLATAQSLFNGVSRQTSPFYGFFRVQHLQELAFQEVLELLTNLAEQRSDSELASFIRTPAGRARVRAVHHLAGGNHRVYVILSEFLSREALDELVEPFMGMLDDLTPYYQSRMALLSPQQRKVVDFLIERRGAVPVKQIAQRCFVTHQTASSTLRALRDRGYVRSEPAGRESYCELADPLMGFVLRAEQARGEAVREEVRWVRQWCAAKESDAAAIGDLPAHLQRAADELQKAENRRPLVKLRFYERRILGEWLEVSQSRTPMPEV